jgi:hypothetical protein
MSTYFGPGAPLCVRLTNGANALYCAGTSQTEALATMRMADRLCRLTRSADPSISCNWRRYAAPTQGGGSLPEEIPLGASQCQSDGYCAIRDSLAPLAPEYTAPTDLQVFYRVNPGTSPSYLPTALRVGTLSGPECPPNLAPAEAAVGTPVKFCAGVAAR